MASPVLASGAAHRPGGRVGPYVLVELLGTGGMGEVWLARRDDGAFRRDVALKLPLLDARRRDVAQRFARERDILARLEHPNIARLYDAGVDRNQPYLAMERVLGQHITTWCDARQLDVDGRVAALPPGPLRGAVRAREPGPPPRPQALQHPRHRRGPGAAPGLRGGDAARPGRARAGHAAHPRHRAGAHPGVREPRADPRGPSGHRERRLLAGGGALRAAHRGASLRDGERPPGPARGGDPPGAAARGEQRGGRGDGRGPGHHRAAAPEAAGRRSGRDPPPGDVPPPRGAVRRRGRAGRGPAPLARPRAAAGPGRLDAAPPASFRLQAPRPGRGRRAGGEWPSSRSR